MRNWYRHNQESHRVSYAELLSAMQSGTPLNNIRTEDLPSEIQAEIEKSLGDDRSYEQNIEGDLVWDLEFVDANSISADLFIPPEVLADEGYDLEGLIQSLKSEGFKMPIISGPSGIEGLHRITAAVSAGIAKVPWLYVHELENLEDNL